MLVIGQSGQRVCINFPRAILILLVFLYVGNYYQVIRILKLFNGFLEGEYATTYD